MPDDAVTSTGLYGKINPWQTRVLRLHPGQRGEALHGDLLVADIVQLPGLVLHEEQERVKYSAVSYAWGEAIFDHQIIVNGKETAVTISLYGALQRFRHASRPRYLWADALCINQSDNEEKSFQVKNMFTIFNESYAVKAWLGEADEKVSLAISFLRNQKTTPEIVEECECRILPSKILEYLTRHLSGDVMAGLRDLGSRSWLSRAWVQQEVYAANQVVVQCGDDMITLDQFRIVSRLLQFTPGLGEALEKNLNILLNLAPSTELAAIKLSGQRARQSTGYCPRGSGKHSARHRCTRPECVFAAVRGVKASDSRDQVYALVSMMDCKTAVGEVEKSYEFPSLEKLPIDYALSTSQIFQLLACCLIKRDRSCQILSRHAPANFNELKLPSWTPDWRDWSHHHGELGCRPLLDYGRMPLSTLHYEWFSGSWDVLRVEGVVSGIFRTISNVPGSFALQEQRWPMSLEYAREMGDDLSAGTRPKSHDWPVKDVLQNGDVLVNLDGAEATEVILRPQKGGRILLYHPLGRFRRRRGLMRPDVW